MARRKRLFKRDSRGRFASGNSSSTTRRRDGRIATLRKDFRRQQILAIQQSIKQERDYIRHTGDVGTPKDQARHKAALAKKQRRIAQLKAQL